MISLYNLILFIFFLPALIYYFISHRTRLREFFYKSYERLGIWPRPSNRANQNEKPLLWVHCASLGEVKAVEPLLNTLRDYKILLTVLTFSGRGYAEKNKLADYIFYTPLDFSFLIKHAVSKFKPKALILVETEIWPGLIFGAKKAGIKIILINGRLSNRSFKYYMLFRSFWKNVIKNIDCLAARSEEDAQRFEELGYETNKLIVTGNIKYDRDFIHPDSAFYDFKANGANLVLVCGSTREGEENILLDAWQRLRKDFRNLLIVLAPRHLKRVGEITKEVITRKINYTLFSSMSKRVSDCIIIDTFGDLQKFYSICDIAFVGGSLIDKGGQNPIEPADYAKPVMFGPYMHNFETEARVLQESGGGFRVKDVDEIVSCAKRLLNDENLRAGAGLKAKQSVEAQKGAKFKTLELIRVMMSQ